MQSWFSRVGGKRILRKVIVPLFPPKKSYNTYVEPFVGAGWIFLAQETDHEVINDIDPFVYHMWKDLQDTSAETIRKMDFSISEKRFNDLKKGGGHRLYRNKYLTLFSYAGNRETLDYSGKKGRGENAVSKMLKVKERIKDVKIENKDWLDVVKKYDSPKTLFYLDPPYFQTDNTAYSHDRIDYEKIAEVMKKMKGFAVLSINDKPEMRKIFKGFKMKKVVVRNHLDNPVVKERKELIIKNF